MPTIKELTQSRRAYSEQRQARLQIKRADEHTHVANEHAKLDEIRGILESLVTSVDNSINQLEKDYPIAMFPVRLETRFNRKNDQSCELLIRIYPDAILANTHQPMLTKNEFKDGKYYWQTEGDTKSAWRGLVKSYGSNRAAWIVRQTSPEAKDIIAFRQTNQTITPYADLLPDKWLVRAMIHREKGTIKIEEESRPIREPLFLMPDSRAETKLLSVDLYADKESLWLYEFEEAEKAGMAARIPLKAQWAQESGKYHIKKLVVFGVKSTMGVDESIEKLEKLLENHHYGRGFSFVPQGTPTNNVTGNKSGYPFPDPDGEKSYDIECASKIAANLDRDNENKLDGNRVKSALGFGDANPFNHIRFADGEEGDRAKQTANYLWQFALQNYVEHIVAPMFPEAAKKESAREFFINYVRGRGPYPAIQVGNVPYGLLPVTALSMWTSSKRSGSIKRLIEQLNQMRQDWLIQSQNLIRVNSDSSDYHDDFMNALAQSASSQAARLRLVQQPKGNVLSQLGSLAPHTTIDVENIPADAAVNWLRLSQTAFRYKNSANAPLLELIKRFFPKDYDALASRISPEELERLIAETLDVCSHRLDAWITAIATWQLDQIRLEQRTGIYLGGYGWVHDIKESGEKSNSEGLIHAPSMNHAAAAAVLRSAHKTRSQDGDSPYAINLSSSRVRKALWLLDGISSDMPLGMLLGYQFERELHDRNLDKYIDEFRSMFQFEINKEVDTSSNDLDTQPSESLNKSRSLRNIVDGFQLWQAWKNDTLLVLLEEYEIQDIGEEIQAILGSIDETIDAVTDLLTAESVYQSVQGNTSGTGAPLDALSKGAHPPTPEIVKTPRTGIPLTQRVAFVMDENSKNFWNNGPTPRSEASPHLNAWVGQRLIDAGSLNKVVCTVETVFPIQETGEDSVTHRGETFVITLADLRLEPLDFLALAVSVEETAYDSELDRRVLHLACEKIIESCKNSQPSIMYPPIKEIRFKINYDPRGLENEIGQEDHTFLQLLEVARAINDFLSHVRPLKVHDLMLPDIGSTYKQNNYVEFDSLGDVFNKGRTTFEEWIKFHLGSNLTALNFGEIICNLYDLRSALDYQIIRSQNGKGAGFHPRTAVYCGTNSQLFEYLRLENQGKNLNNLTHKSLSTAVQLSLEDFKLLASIMVNALHNFAKDRNPKSKKAFKKYLDFAFVRFDSDVVVQHRQIIEQTLQINVDKYLSLDDIERRATFWQALLKFMPSNEAHVKRVFKITLRGINLDFLFVFLKKYYSGDAVPFIDQWGEDQIEQTLDVLQEFAHLLNSGLDRDTLSGLIRIFSQPIESVHYQNAITILELAAQYSIQNAYPSLELSKPAIYPQKIKLIKRLRNIRSVVSERLDKVARLTTASHTMRLKALFGDSLIIIPAFHTPREHKYKDSVLAVLREQPSSGKVEDWISQAARVRKPLDRWRRLNIYVNTVSKIPTGKQVLQLPGEANTRWSALEFDSESLPVAGTTSIVLMGRDDYDDFTHEEPITGLFLDEWIEQIPNKEEETGVAFHYDSPNTEAPQAVLLAVPPPGANWTKELLAKTVDETLEIAQIRGVESGGEGYERLLPAIYLDAEILSK